MLLTTGPVAAVAPPAAAVQTFPLSTEVSPLLTKAYEAAVARVDSDFISQAQGLDNLLVARIEHYEAMLASGAEATGARVERVGVGRHSRIRVIRAPGLSPLFNAEFAHQEAFLNAKAAQLSSNSQFQLANLATEFSQSGQFAVPTTAFSGNVRAAATAFSSEVATALSSAASSFQTGALWVNTLATNPASIMSTEGQILTANLGASGAASAAGSISGGVLPPSTELLSSAVNQALYTLSTNIQSISVGLQQNFAALQTQFDANVASLTSSFETAPLGTFATLPAYNIGTVAFAGLTGGLLSPTGGALGTTTSAGTSGGSAGGPGTAGGNTGVDGAATGL